MKKIVLAMVGCFSAFALFAQIKVVDRAIVSTTINIVAPDDDESISEVSGGPSSGGGNVMRITNTMDGETKMVSYVKGNLSKVDINSEMMSLSIYSDESTKEKTSIFKVMGRTFGIKSTPEDEAAGKKRMDSLMAERSKTDSSEGKRQREGKLPKTISVEYLADSKKISGFNCKKALIITDRVLRKDTQAVWYCPDFKINGLSADLGSGIPMARQFGNFGGDGFEKVDGTVIMFEKKLPRGRTMEYKVTKVEMDKDIAASEFEVPKDVEIRSAKEAMQGGGGMRMMMGGGR
jgi:hypothetical protein